MGQAEKKEKISPEVFAAMTLDDISVKLSKMLKLQEAQIEEGVKDEATISVSGTIPVPMTPYLLNSKSPYFKVAVFNDGPDPVYVMLNEIQDVGKRKAPLNQGDKLDMATALPKINELFFACDEGNTASVRVHALK